MTVYIRVSKSWANFHFWVNYPFKLPHSTLDSSVDLTLNGLNYFYIDIHTLYNHLMNFPII